VPFDTGPRVGCQDLHLVFLHRLKAVTPWHKTADVFAFLFLFAAVASTDNTPLWCAFFAGLFAVAILIILIRRIYSPKSFR